MIREEIMTMTADELRLAIAKAKGLDLGNDPDSAYYAWGVPRWTTSIADAWELEGEVPPEETENYARELAYVINQKGDFSIKWLYQIAHATPLQRSRAWLLWKTEAE
ncbi:MAG: hypothetical protein ACYC5K_02465 [Saccharofermentanales bacterium]